MGKKITLATIFNFIILITVAQEISPFGKFRSDSIKIGEEIQYSLSVKYPIDWQVIFPDSTFDYTPFEFYSKEFFPTRTDSAFAYDSAVYFLSSFEVDLIQKLQLPIYLLDGNDSAQIFTVPDSVFLVELVQVIPDSLVFRENVSYQEVNYEFNYPYFMMGLGILLAIVILILAVFGKSIKNRIKKYRLRKANDKFIIDFKRGMIKIKQNETNTDLIEEILVIWKKYMEKLEDRPFTKYTSKEILAVGFEKQLKSVLQNIDKSIYGSLANEEMHKNFELLESFTQERYDHKISEIKNG